MFTDSKKNCTKNALNNQQECYPIAMHKVFSSDFLHFNQNRSVNRTFRFGWIWIAKKTLVG